VRAARGITCASPNRNIMILPGHIRRSITNPARSCEKSGAQIDRAILLPRRRHLRQPKAQPNPFPGLMPDGKGNVTPWWSPYDAYDVDPGWWAKKNMAKVLRVSIH